MSEGAHGAAGVGAPRFMTDKEAEAALVKPLGKKVEILLAYGELWRRRDGGGWEMYGG